MKNKTLHNIYDNLPDTFYNTNPPVKSLYALGNIKDQKRVAIIGSRKYSSYGKQVCSDISAALATRQVSIVSGLAYGIDSVAHRSCLAASGHTIAVLPGDLKHIYPRAHSNLARQILENGGALISEHKNKDNIKKHDFLLRNRIIAAISDALIVVEANIRSGTMSTVRHALDIGVPVYAVPGSIYSPGYTGCNMLIENGANPIRSIESLLNDLGLEKAVSTFKDKIESDLMQEIESLEDPTINDLFRQTSIDITKLNTKLTELEIAGHIYFDAGRIYKR